MLALSTRPISQVIKRMSSFIPAGIIASLHSAHGLRYWGCCVFLLLAGCAEPWNNPYPAAQSGENILYNAFAERPKHLDPVQSYSTNEILFTAQIYQPPLQYHYLKRPFELIPQTATTLPTVRYYDANDVALPADAEEVAFSVYEIHIKPEIHYQPHPAFARDVLGDFLYHTQTASDLKQIQKIADFEHDDTRELLADDYLYQIKRLAHPKLHSPIFGLMADYIVGLREYAETLSKHATANPDDVYLDLRQFPLSGVEKVDDHTYRIRIKGKYPQFIYWLAMPFFAPIPWEADRFFSQPGLADKNITLDWYPVGTGPYMLTENDPNSVMVLERNPNFQGEHYPAEGMPEDVENNLLQDADQPLPFIDKIIFSREKESIPRWNKFLQGYYDASGIGSDSFDQAVQISGQGETVVTEGMGEQGIRLETAVAPSTYYMGFNMLDTVVGGRTTQEKQAARKLRQAISIAVDYEEFISIFANGRGLAAQSPIPPGIEGYRDGKAGINSIVYEWHNGGPRRRSIKVAKRLLAEAGYPDGIDKKSGKPLVLYFDVTTRSADDKAILDWMRKQFRKINIHLVVRSTDYNRFQDKIRSGNAQIFEWGWNADYPDPENFLFLLYGPQRKVGNNGENAANYDNAEFNRLFERMNNMESGPQRAQIIDQMLAILREDAPWLWGYHPKDYALYHAWYQNVKPNRLSNNNMKYWRIDHNLRAQKQREWNEPVLWPLGIVFFLLMGGLLPAWLAYRRREQGRSLTTQSS
ncbi:Bacterial extracellular solute-binding protein, family 5 [Nitrosomonas mobilis]|uniref:Bacterial extracellular solute-binding protein, family 5 n=2 Tax=Nitrosomonas mobilis TaxID=51642 RepID=A0A1G5SG03_9PROT|nr:Bacterial extracellular solute-binding protein, family 5 [Nitrosomonas mobilis]